MVDEPMLVRSLPGIYVYTKVLHEPLGVSGVNSNPIVDANMKPLLLPQGPQGRGRFDPLPGAAGFPPYESYVGEERTPHVRVEESELEQ